jgi:hypothetical protein
MTQMRAVQFNMSFGVGFAPQKLLFRWGSKIMAVSLRKGRTKTLLQSSIDSALLAVEIYNKPRTTFRCEGFIALMVISWTRLFHAYFNHTIGNKYFYKKKTGRYETVDGERKAWELST